ncbi:MAG: hypothetical protein WKF64_07275 [Ilumatobacteraceae bacterium]
MPGKYTQFKGSAFVGLQSSTVTNKALTTNVATLTTAAAHNLAPGQIVKVTIGDPVFDGIFTLTVASGTTLSYAKVNANVVSAAATGVVGAMVDYKNQITAIKWVFGREKNTIPPTLGTGTEDIEPGTRQRTLEVTFLNQLAQAGFYRRLLTSIDADGELDVDTLLSDAAVSASNPRRSGRVIVPEAAMGGQVGALRTTTSTFRVKAGTYVKASV